MIKITIKTGNSAFEDDKEYEIARILNKLAKDISLGKEPTKLMDINGNSVGKVEYE